MKNFILSTLVVGSITNSYGFGLPEEDPVIRDLRAKFRNASAPSSKFLFSRTWNQCVFASAIKGEFKMEPRPGTVTFKALGGYVAVRNYAGAASAIPFATDYFFQTSAEWISYGSSLSRNPQPTLAAAIRVDGAGNLIIEGAEFVLSGFKNGTTDATLGPIANLSNQAKVSSYVTCQIRPEIRTPSENRPLTPFASVRSENPIFAHMRSRYNEAHAPTLSKLTSGYWDECLVAYGITSEYLLEQETAKLRFTSLGSYVTHDIRSFSFGVSDDRPIFARTNDEWVWLRKDTSDIYGGIYRGTYTIGIREEDSGDLIVENSVLENSNDSPYRPISTAAPSGSQVTSYYACMRGSHPQY